MKRNINIVIITGLLAFSLILACKKKLDVLDENNPTTISYFKTAEELRNGVNAIYSTLRSGNLVGREWFFLHDMRGGETWAGGAQLEAPRAELLKQASPAPSNSVMSSVWTGAYQMINRANTILSVAPGVTDNTTLRDQLIGETKFLRAWAYFELVSQWGEVPVYSAPITSSSDFKGKSPTEEVYTLIITDLNDAAQALPEVASQPGRVTKGAVNALLGRVQMQKGDYAAAKEALLKVYGKYTLRPNFLDNFSGDVKLGSTVLTTGDEFNSESIFEVAFVDKGDNNFNWGYTGEGPTVPVSTVHNQEYGIVWGNVIPSDRLLSEFEPNDPRYKFTIYEEGDKILTKGGTDPGVTMTAADMNVDRSIRNGIAKKRIFRKYSILDWTNDGFHPGGINQRLIRYSDVLLMLAECEAEVGTPAKAADYINEVRARPSVNMPRVVLTSKNQALKAVMHERSVELAIEAVNSIDILRWRKKGYFPSIMPDPKPGQVDMFPIPAIETATNPLLK
jgi:hypothetical protein